MKQWDIWTCDFAEAGPHPAVIVSHPDRVARAPLVNVLIASSRRAGRPARENEVMLNGTDGLDWETLVKCDLIYLVEKVQPPATGAYRFFLRSDDGSELQLSPDEEIITEPENQEPAAEVRTACCEPFQEPAVGEARTSEPFDLNAEQRHGITVVADTFPPVPRAGAIVNRDGTTVDIGVAFDEPVTDATVGVAANYSVSVGTVQSIAYHSSSITTQSIYRPPPITAGLVGDSCPQNWPGSVASAASTVRVDRVSRWGDLNWLKL